MGNTRKQIAFDLDTGALKIYYPSESWNNAYEVIRNHMTANGFRWLQGSVYVSEKTMPSYKVARILDELIAKNPWLNVCMRDCREANIGKEHNKNHIFNVTVQDGGKMSIKMGVKLAYKLIFILIFTSDGHPMLLDRKIRSRRYAVLNSYYSTKKRKCQRERN